MHSRLADEKAAQVTDKFAEDIHPNSPQKRKKSAHRKIKKSPEPQRLR